MEKIKSSRKQLKEKTLKDIVNGIRSTKIKGKNGKSIYRSFFAIFSTIFINTTAFCYFHFALKKIKKYFVCIKYITIIKTK